MNETHSQEHKVQLAQSSQTDIVQKYKQMDMKSLLGIQLNFSTSVQLLRAGRSPGIPNLLLDSADTEYPICAPHWKSEKLNSAWGK